jgi:predicted DNA repair protein MutK
MEVKKMEQIIFLLVCLVVFFVGLGVLVRGIAGQRGAHAYTHMWQNLGRSVARFIRWTLRQHWQFWLGFVIGAITVYLYMSPP